MFSNTPNRPETEILRRVIERREELGLTQKEVGERVGQSDLYGEYTHGTYRNLERTNFEDACNPRTALNVQLVRALSEALECSVERLANHRELEAIRDVPYRHAQWPESMLAELAENQPRTTVATPGMVAKRIDAYRRQYAYRSTAEFAKKLREYKISISDKTMSRVIGPKPDQKTQSRVITFEFCETVAQVFRGRMNQLEFDVQWLLKCHDRCPHCYPIMIDG